MHIRLATTRDLHRLTDITVSSLPDDPTFDFMWPHRDKYPEDNFFFWQLHLEKLMYDKETVFLVMVLDEGDKGPDVLSISVPDTIISYAIWAREGSSREAWHQWNKKDTWMNVLDRLTCNVTTWSVSRKYSRRDADPLRLKSLSEATEAAEKQYFSKFPDKWTMELLVTDKRFRRRGAASALIAWGTDMADNEGLVCKVEASWMGVIVYKAAGFKVLSDWTVQVPGQKEKLRYWIMFRGHCHKVPPGPAITWCGRMAA